MWIASQTEWRTSKGKAVIRIMNVQRWSALLGLALGFPPQPAVSAGDVTLVRDGSPSAVIRVAERVMEPDNPDISAQSLQHAKAVAESQRQQLREAVKDLARCLEKMSGARIEIVCGSKLPDSSIPIHIGELAIEKFGKPQKSAPFKQGFRVVISPKGIGLMGESDLATTYAIYELLDRLGCRWFMPSAMGESIPGMKTIRLREDDFSSAPATIYRGIWYADDDFKRRNRLGGMPLSISHALEEYVTEAQLKAHPDWNAEIGGKRKVGGLICWGNPDVARAIADRLIADLDQGIYATTISLSPNDGATFCECERCKALDAGDWDTTMGCVSITDRLIHFQNQIVEAVTRKHPDVLFGTNAYVQYTRPPVREKLHPNLVPIIAAITYCRAHSMDNKDCPTRQELRKISEGWLKASKNVGLYEFGWNLAEQSAPFPMITKWGEDLKFLYDRGLSFWTPETQSNFESSGPGLYLGIRMSFQAKADPKAIMEEFYARFYGPAAPAMKRYWTIFDDAWSRIPEHAGCGFGYEKRFTPRVLNSARVTMDEALASCKPEQPEYQRVKLADERLRQFEMFMAMQRKLNVFYTGQFDLAYDSEVWMKNEMALSRKYKDQFAFTYVGYGPGYPKTTAHFLSFYHDTYKDATRIAENYKLLTNLGFPIRQWKFKVDREKEGETKGWHKKDFDDTSWETTDVCVDTWSALGLFNYFGPVWYSYNADLPTTKGKVYLWFSRTDGDLKLFVNGKHVPYVNDKGKKSDEFSGYCKPVSFDITSAMVEGGNRIAVRCTRPALDELGIGGLMGPTVIYSDKKD